MIFVPVYVAAAAIQWVIFHLTAVAPLVALDGRHGAVTASLAVLLGGVGGLFASVIATAAVAVILSERDAGRRILAGQAYRRVLGRWRSLARGMATELGMVLLLTITAQAAVGETAGHSWLIAGCDWSRRRCGRFL